YVLIGYLFSSMFLIALISYVLSLLVSAMAAPLLFSWCFFFFQTEDGKPGVERFRGVGNG
ncbi:hypothetical protein, partial [Escherichia coli]|uniref:hypothetical protein n=1 Tax=Escherichia coli TaxID=562 RepID=UPI000B680EA9